MRYLVLLFLTGCGLTVKVHPDNEVYRLSNEFCPMNCEAFGTEWNGKITIRSKSFECICEFKEEFGL